MGKYTEACAGASANTNILATGGIDKKGITGAYKHVFWAADSFEFASVVAAKDIANFNAAVQAGNLIYLGMGQFEDQSSEAQFFENQALNIREEQVAASKVLRMISAVCACSHAELKKLEGKEGRLFIQTSKNFLIGRLTDDGKVIGRALSSIIVNNRTVPTNDTPVEYTQIDFTFADNDGDELNPAEVLLDFIFSEVDQVYPGDGVSSGTSTNGATLSTTITITEDCSTDPLIDAVLADFKAEDEDGNALTIASVTENPADSGQYDIDITTALTKAYVSFDGIRSINSELKYVGPVLVST